MKPKTFILIFLWVFIAGLATVALGLSTAPETVINLYDLGNAEFTFAYMDRVGGFMISLLTFQIPDIPAWEVILLVWIPSLTLIIMLVMLLRGVSQ